MKRRYAAIAMSLLLGSCAASEDNKSNAPKPAETPIATPVAASDAAAVAVAKLAIPSVASVQLVQDCPDPKSEQAKADMADEPMRKAKRKAGSGPLQQPCTQSTIQLAFTGQGPKSASVRLKEVRLLSADGKALGTLASRMPSIWKDSGYEAWDGVLAPDSDQKASFKLSLPDWSAVEAALGGSSFGPMYTLEVDVDIEGTVTTVRSPQFERGRPEIIKT